MTIIVFLIDTSASMNQRAYLGGRPTLLDVAKSAVETFVKVRQRSPESRGDRYMLLTFEDTPHNIKAGWKENLATFMNELKNLQCIGLTTLGAALKNAFDILNINRMQTGIDTYGQGRCPFYLEPSVIVVITDGGKYTNTNGVQQDFGLPMHAPIPGSELTKEPFRWDQRLFCLVLRLSGTPVQERDTGLVASDSSPIDAMCEVTGGRSYCITSHRMMMQCIDSLVQKVQSGVVINFEKIGPDPPPLTNEVTATSNAEEDNNDEEGTSAIFNGGSKIQGNFQSGAPGPSGAPPPQPLVPNNTAWHSCRKLIYVPRSAQKGFAVGFWPIPESFWPDLQASSLPPRSAHPIVKFACTSQEPLVIENLPFDKYELEPSPLTQYILARKQPTVCWQVFVANSYRASEVGHPFGYLKASTNLTCVNLFVMPYNYPVLMPLLDELFKIHRLKPSNEWRAQFTNYMRTMPTYYAPALRRALTRMNMPAALAQTLIPDSMDNALSYGVLNYLKRLKNQAKIEFDRLCNEVISKQVANKSLANSNTNAILEGVRVTSRATLKKDLVSHPVTDLRDELNKFSGFVVGLVRNKQQQRGAQSYRNAFDIPRKSLLDQVIRMRANFLQPSLMHTKLLDDDFVHSMPVSQMGNYQEYLKRMTPPLREIESAPVRQHMFGNPFKIDKRMMVDEADIDLVGATSSSAKGIKRSLSVSDLTNGSGNNRTNQSNKRKPGPIPKDFPVPKPYARRASSLSPHNTPPASPVPWLEEPKSPETPPDSPVLVTPPTTPLVMTPEKLINGLSSEVTFLNIPEVVNIKSEFTNSHDLPVLPQSVVNNVYSVKNLVKQDSNVVVKTESGSSIKSEFNNRSSITLHSSSGTSTTIVSFGDNISLNDNNGLVSKNNLVSKCEVVSNHIGEINPKVEKERPLSTKELEEIRKNNLAVRDLTFKEIRRKGTNHAALFSHLQNVQGTLDVRLSFIKEVIKESLRFKRRNLAANLEEYMQKVQSDDLVINHKMNHNGATTRIT